MKQWLCLVCGEVARNTLGIRCRFGRQRDALWAPDIDAYLCDKHAKAGCEITVDFTPTEDGIVTITTVGPRQTVSAALQIGTGRKLTPGQGSLL